MTARLPDFIIIGTMKSGTTSLFRWLGDIEGVTLPEVKEPGFFARPDLWPHGLADYSGLFAAASHEQVTGEASVIYTDPRQARGAATRIAEALPDVRLICVLRNPLQRLRSHYRHEVQRGRERRPLLQALADGENPYIQLSLYHSALEPYLDLFPSERRLILRFEDLVATGSSGFGEVLSYLGLPPGSVPDAHHNETAVKRGFTAPVRTMWEMGLLDRLQWLPRPIRRAGYRLLTVDSGQYRKLMQSSDREDIPSEVEEAIWADVSELEKRLGKGSWWNR